MLVALLTLAVLQEPGAILREARSAQSAFERTRRFLLPRTNAEVGRRCDEQVGGICYWYDDRELPPPPEGGEIAAARAALLVELGAAAARLPDDPWILGQRIRYLLEAGRGEEALSLTSRCAGHDSWCAALAGLTLHRQGAIAPADSAFSAALALAPAGERCRWLDISLLLERAAAREWRALSCEAQVEQAEAWLERGRPLLAQHGNSVRTEFLARQAMVRVAAGTVTPYGTRLDDAHRELVLRYGWPIGWSQVPARGIWGEASVVGHDPSPSWGLAPRALGDAPVDLDAERPRARFQPPSLTAIFAIEDVQLARFPRRDGTLLLAAWQLPPASPLNTEGVTGVLAGKPVGEEPIVIGQVADGRGGVATASSPAILESAGLELLTADGATWARHREEWPEPLPAAGPVLSDLLLFEPGESPAEHLEDVLPRAIRGTAVRRGGAVGLYWEWGRLPPGADSVSIRIAVRPRRGGSAALAWSWPSPDPARRSGEAAMTLDLGRLGRGGYVLEVVMTIGATILQSQRTFQVT